MIESAYGVGGYLRRKAERKEAELAKNDEDYLLKKTLNSIVDNIFSTSIKMRNNEDIQYSIKKIRREYGSASFLSQLKIKLENYEISKYTGKEVNNKIKETLFIDIIKFVVLELASKEKE